jgi:hypothetical protein
MTMLELTSDLVFAKSDKGASEISRRQHGLSPRQRAILILVDGKVSVGELLQRMAGFSGALESLHLLIHEGFVALVQNRADAPAPRAAGQSGAVSDKPVVEQLGDLARELLAEHAERVVAKLESTDPAAGSIDKRVEGCGKLIRLTIDERKAEAFVRRAQRILLEAA